MTIPETQKAMNDGLLRMETGAFKHRTRRLASEILNLKAFTSSSMTTAVCAANTSNEGFDPFCFLFVGPVFASEDASQEETKKRDFVCRYPKGLP